MGLETTNRNFGFGYYAASINIRQSSNISSGAMVWALRNAANSTKEVFIERIFANMSFDETTPLARTLLRYGIGGFMSAMPTGGTAVQIAKLDSNNPTSCLEGVKVLDTGLTTSGLVIAPPSATVSCPAVSGVSIMYVREGITSKLAPGEGIYISLASDARIGQGLCGGVVWSERSL